MIYERRSKMAAEVNIMPTASQDHTKITNKLYRTIKLKVIWRLAEHNPYN